MVHVASAGGRHKMLAFEPAEPLLPDATRIITVNTSEANSSNNSSSSPSPSSSSVASEPVAIVSEVHRELQIIAEEPSPVIFNHHNNHSNAFHNGKGQRGKMNQNRDGSNGNANFLVEEFTSTINANMNEQQRKTESLTLISHGLTDSVCETLKYLDNENENVQNSTVFTEEIVVSKKAKTGIMKTTTHSSQATKAEEWHKHDHIMEDGSINESNDSEDMPIIPPGIPNPDSTNATTHTHPSSPPKFGSDPTDSPNASKSGGVPGQHNKLSSLGNGKHTGHKRVSFGNSKGSMVETLVFPVETPVPEESTNVTTGGTPGVTNVPTSNEDETTEAGGGSSGGSRPPSRVRVTFFESEKPLAVSSPESDNFDFDLSNMTLPGSPNATDHPHVYNRQISEGWDNPFRPDGDLSKEADQIVELIKEGKPINEETLRSKSPSMNESFNQASPRGKNANGTVNGSGGPDTVQHGVVPPAGQATQVEHVVLKKKKGCCVIQ